VEKIAKKITRNEKYALHRTQLLSTANSLLLSIYWMSQNKIAQKKKSSIIIHYIFFI